jgi:hypothetical protein
VSNQEGQAVRAREPGREHLVGSAQARKRGSGSKRPRTVVGLRARDGTLGFIGRKPGKRIKFLFFFLFNYFKTFSNGFESYFEFESNHSIQKFQCNSMSAQTYFYPYI